LLVQSVFEAVDGSGFDDVNWEPISGAHNNSLATEIPSHFETTSFCNQLAAVTSQIVYVTS